MCGEDDINKLHIYTKNGKRVTGLTEEELKAELDRQEDDANNEIGSVWTNCSMTGL